MAKSSASDSTRKKFVTSIIDHKKPKAINIPINIDDIHMHINATIHIDTVVLRAYPIHSDIDCKVDNTSTRQRTVAYQEEAINNQIDYLTNIIAEDCKKALAPSPIRDSDTQNMGIFTTAFYSDDPESPDSPYRHASWRDHVYRRYYTYMCNNILNRMDAHGQTITASQMSEIENDLINEIIKSKKGDGTYSSAKRTVARHLRTADEFLRILYELHPDLPRVFFHARIPPQIIPEQAKSLPDAVRVTLAYTLLKLISVGLAMGVASLLFLGLRPAEACAIIIGDIIRLQYHTVYPVTHQIAPHGERTDILKTQAAYRYTVGINLLRHIIDERIEYLQEQGYDYESCLRMPFVSSPKLDTEFAKPSDLSEYAKRLLMACGCTQELLLAAKTLMEKEPDYDGLGNKEDSLSAYLIRRDWMSRCANICGMESPRLDHHGGHKQRQPTGEDYANEDVQKESAMILERHVLIPEFSQHPYYDPLIVSSSLSFDIDNTNGFKIIADRDMIFKLNLTTVECGEQLVIKTNGDLAGDVKILRGRKDTPNLRVGRPVVGDIKPLSYYHSIEQNISINLDEFMP